MEIQYITQVNVSQVERLMYNSGHPAERCEKFLNILSGSEANITISCEMAIFNFLWLIWDHYLPLAPT